MGDPIWLYSIVSNTFCNQFQKQTLWVADKRVELDGIRLDDGDIYLIIQWYENIPGIYESYLVYRLYYDNPPQAQIRTQIVHGKISMAQISGTTEKHTSARYKSTSQSESLYVNDLQCKLNGGNKLYNNISAEIIF